MATILSKTKTVATVGGSSGAYTHKLEVIQNSQSVTNNRTNFTINGYIKPNHSSWGWAQFSSPKIILYYIKNGTRTNVASVTIEEVETNNTTYQKLATSTFNINHNNDGSLEVTFGYEFAPNTSSYSYISASASISSAVTIDSIPRASTISIPRTYIEETALITITRASNSFTHTLSYKFGNLSGTIVEKTVETSIPFDIPFEFYAEIPASATGNCTITCQTYSGSTLIGTSTKTFVVECDEERCKPTLEASVIDINELTLALTQNENKLIKYRSTAQLDISSNLKNSAYMSKVVINGERLVGTITTENGQYSTTQVYENESVDNFIIEVTDSRGFITELTLTPEVIQYKELSINAEAMRVDATSGKITLEYSGNYYQGSLGIVDNTLSLVYRYRENVSSAEWTDWIDLEKNINEGKYSGTFESEAIFDYKKVYAIEIQAEDKLSIVIANGDALKIQRGEPIYWWDENAFYILVSLILREKIIFENETEPIIWCEKEE